MNNKTMEQRFNRKVSSELFTLQMNYMLALRDIQTKNDLDDIDIIEYLRSTYCDRYQTMIMYNFSQNFDFDFPATRPEDTSSTNTKGRKNT